MVDEPVVVECMVGEHVVEVSLGETRMLQHRDGPGALVGMEIGLAKHNNADFVQYK